MMIRAGKRDEVLQSDSMWMCTSCYGCHVSCPRKVPVSHVMHGIAEYAYRTGRVNVMDLTQTLYFKDGLFAGIKKLIEMQSIGMGMVRARRMNPLEAIGAGHKCKDIKGIHAMLAKAKEIEA